MKIATQARRLKFDFAGIRHRQQVQDVFLLVSNSPVLLYREQHVGWAAAIGDKTGPSLAAFLALPAF